MTGRHGKFTIFDKPVTAIHWDAPPMPKPLSTADALLAAVSATPDDDTPKLVLADFWDELDPVQPSPKACELRLAVAMRRVIAEPDRDDLRLAWADVAERYGMRGRAGYVRDAVELATLTSVTVFTISTNVAGDHDSKDGCTNYRPVEAAADRWRRGLKTGGVYVVVPDLGDPRGWTDPLPSCDDLAKHFRARAMTFVGVRDDNWKFRESSDATTVRAAELMTRSVRHIFHNAPQERDAVGVSATVFVSPDRGFWKSVTCPASDWLSFGDRIRREQPVVAVNLTTMPQVVFEPQGNPPWPLVRLSGRIRPLDGDSRPRATDDPETFPLRLLELEWPGVRFTLPPEQRNLMANALSFEEYNARLRGELADAIMAAYPRPLSDAERLQFEADFYTRMAARPLNPDDYRQRPLRERSERVRRGRATDPDTDPPDGSDGSGT